MSKTPKDDFVFGGFEQSNTTPVPDILFDELLPRLSGTELKVLLYIIRRTAGFKKTTDSISLSQFINGITTRDGRQLDHGCGVKRRQSIIDALIELEKIGCIVSHKTKTPDNDNATTAYQVCFKGVVSKTDHPPELRGGFKNGPPSFKNDTTGGFKNGLGVVSKTDPQETVLQETVLQESKNGEPKNDVPSPAPSTSLIANTDTENEESKATRNASTPRNTEPLMSEARRVFALLCERFFAVPPAFTPKIEEQCTSLAPHVKTSEDLNGLWDYTRDQIKEDPRYKKKRVYLGNLLEHLDGWRQERMPVPAKPEAPKLNRPKTVEEMTALEKIDYWQQKYAKKPVTQEERKQS